MTPHSPDADRCEPTNAADAARALAIAAMHDAHDDAHHPTEIEEAYGTTRPAGRTHDDPRQDTTTRTADPEGADRL